MRCSFLRRPYSWASDIQLYWLRLVKRRSITCVTAQITPIYLLNCWEFLYMIYFKCAATGLAEFSKWTKPMKKCPVSFWCELRWISNTWFYCSTKVLSKLCCQFTIIAFLFIIIIICKLNKWKKKRQKRCQIVLFGTK